jgi:GMP synthase (glutamine-hydrolysing)
MTRKNVLLLKSGDAANPVRVGSGDYDRWFVQTIGQDGIGFEVVNAHLGQKLPARPRDFDAVIVTGSPLSVTEPAPWMRQTAGWMREAGEQRVPVLGVCFGHQLLAWSFGVPIVKNRLGREIGTIEVDLTPEGRADPLFSGLPGRLTVQATHEDIAAEVPKGTTLLASNELCGVQAFAAGKYLRAVQFHPEIQPGAMKSLIQARAEKLDSEAVTRGAAPGERVPQLLAGIRVTPHGRKILTNFLEQFS